MDSSSYFIFEKIKNKEQISYWEILSFFIVIPLLTAIFRTFNENVRYYFSIITDKISFKKSNGKTRELLFQAFEGLTNGKHYICYSDDILVLYFYVYKNKLSNKCRVINKDTLQRYTYSDGSKGFINVPRMCFIIDSELPIKLNNEISMTIRKENLAIEKQENVPNSETKTIFVSVHGDYDKILAFIKECKKEYDAFIAELEKGKLYHFVYTGNNTFIDEVYSNINNEQLRNYETFDNLINEHTQRFINDINQLKDFEYYKRTGLRRKKGYLFYGPPGCGKTASVLAMANYDNRHILEIPLSRVKTNEELEQILTQKSINGISFEKNEIIILFDEIDRYIGGKVSIDSSIYDIKNKDEKNNKEKSKNGTKEKTKNKENDEDEDEDNDSKSEYIKARMKSLDLLNMGMILSKLDGIGNYNGVIIIATTNNKDKLDPALYRDLRLTPIEFNYLRTIDIKSLIEKYFEKKIMNEDISKLPDRNAKLTPAKLMILMENNKDELNMLLNELNSIKNNK